MTINGNNGYYSNDRKEFSFDREGIRIATETNATDDITVLKQIFINKIRKCGYCEKELFEDEQFCTNCGEKIYVINEKGEFLPPEKEIVIEDFMFTIPGDYKLQEPIFSNGTYHSTSYINEKNSIHLSVNTDIIEDYSYEDEVMVLNGKKGYYSKDTKEFYFDWDGNRIYLETDAINDKEILNQIHITKIRRCEYCGEELAEDEKICQYCGEKL